MDGAAIERAARLLAAARQTGDPPQRVAADLAFELFFLKHELFSHGSLDLAVAGRIDT